jgi:hypothetical protein
MKALSELAFFASPFLLVVITVLLALILRELRNRG